MQREVIKWIQSLDLSFTIHNPRRDLMNGFVVAEILSRYDKNISMHSFDTGSALAKRLDNWQQISKALQRLKCTNVTEELIALVVQGREGAGRRLLEEMYMFLTKKKLHVSPIDGTGTGAAGGLPLSGAASTIQHAQELPAYMRPTAAKVLRDENDATKERYCQLTGKTDQLKLLAQSEQALESHAVALQAQKFQDPDRFKPKAHPPPESARTRSAKNETSTSRTRQKLQAARQMAVRGIDDTILAAFAQRQEHEREEAFKAQFDPTDDLSSALSRVCVRPLQQSGLCEALDEYSAAEAGVTPAPVSSGSSVPPPTSGDYFTKFILHRNVVPPEAKALVWTALMGAANNIAKHANLRLEELYHLTNTLEFAISNHSKHASDAFGGDDSGDADRALELLISVGQHWQRLDLDNPVTAACLVLIPSWAEAACNGARDAIQRFAALLHAFCNNRDVESVKKIINAFAANSTNVAKNASLTSALLEKIDARLCLGMEDVLEYYASSLLASPRASDRGAGLRLLKPLSWVSPRRVDAFLETMRSLMLDVDWEVRLILLQITAVLFEAASAPKPPALDSGSTTASPRGRSQSISAQDAAGGDSETSVNAAAPASVSIRETGHLLTAAFDCLEGFSPQVRRASLLAIAPYLNYDAQPALCDAFITRLYGLGSQHIRACLAHSEVPEGLPGRIAPAYQTSDVVSVWNSVAVACALINARPQLTTLDFLTVLEPLIHRADLNGANRSVWIAVGEQAKPDVVDSVYNPANLRGVTEQQLTTCNRLATSVAVRLYTEMSGEDDGDLHDSQGDQDSESLARKLQERALDWMQSAL